MGGGGFDRRLIGNAIRAARRATGITRACR
jgi:hypothetical protein